MITDNRHRYSGQKHPFACRHCFVWERVLTTRHFSWEQPAFVRGIFCLHHVQTASRRVLLVLGCCNSKCGIYRTLNRLHSCLCQFLPQKSRTDHTQEDTLILGYLGPNSYREKSMEKTEIQSKLIAEVLRN